MDFLLLSNRWSRDEKGRIETHPESQKPILKFVAIQRRDTDQWAIPGVIEIILKN